MVLMSNVQYNLNTCPAMLITIGLHRIYWEAQILHAFHLGRVLLWTRPWVYLFSTQGQSGKLQEPLDKFVTHSQNFFFYILTQTCWQDITTTATGNGHWWCLSSLQNIWIEDWRAKDRWTYTEIHNLASTSLHRFYPSTVDVGYLSWNFLAELTVWLRLCSKYPKDMRKNKLSQRGLVKHQTLA